MLDTSLVKWDINSIEGFDTEGEGALKAVAVMVKKVRSFELEEGNVRISYVKIKQRAANYL